MSYHHGLAGFDPAPFEAMQPGDWTGQGVDPNLIVGPSQWNPTLSLDPVHVAAVNQMLANGTNPVTGQPTLLNRAVLGKGYRWQGAGDIVDPNTQATVGNAFVLGISGVQALPDAQRGPIAFAADAVEFQPPPIYTGPPSGWHAGALDGIEGYWAPDGLFYAGTAPWDHYIPGSGKSIHTARVKPQAVPLLPAGDPTNAATPTDVTPGMEHPEPVAVPVYDVTAVEYVPVPSDTPLTPGIPDAGGTPPRLVAGLSGTTALLLGAGLLGALFMMGKRK